MVDAGHIITKYRPQLCGLMFRRHVPIQDWDDVLQEVAIKIHLSIQRRTMDQGRDPFNYVYTTAINCINDHLEAYMRKPRVKEEWMDAPHRPDIEGEADANRIRGIVRTLSAVDRDMVEHVIAGYNLAEYGKERGITRFRAWHHWQRIEQTLRRKLAA